MQIRHGRFHQPLTGALFALVAISFFAVQDVLIKALSGEFSLFQILFIRSVVVTATVFLILYFRKGLAGFATSRKKDHAYRVFYNFTAFVSYYFAVTRLPLAEATAIGLSTPLFMTLLSGPLLGEPADMKRKCILVLGFIGVFIVIQPDFNETDWLGVFAAILGAFMFAMLATFAALAVMVWVTAPR